MDHTKQKQVLSHTADVDIQALTLVDIIDLDVLQHLQDSFAHAFKMPSIIYGPEGTPITTPSCFTTFCALVRSTPKGAERCEAFDAKLIRSLRKNPQPTIRHGCALNNMVTGTVPIIIHGHHLANWGIGQMINRTLDLDEVTEYATAIGVDQEKLVGAAQTLIPVDEAIFQRALSYLQILSEQVSMLGFKNLEQAREIGKRKQAEKSLQKAHDELEAKVQKRTQDLVQVNENLRHEIHERQQAEKNEKTLRDQLHQAQKMEAIGLMAGGVAHDLNNILTSLTGYPELLLLQIPQESELRRPIKAMKEAGERAAAVVADLLTVARGVASSKVVANLNTLVTEYFDSPECRQIQAMYQQVKQQQVLADELPNIFCSPVHIKKCIMNLVTNAAEAIDQSGNITITTSTVTPDLQWANERGMKRMEYVLLTVTDTGIGIPKEDIDHVFEPFYTKKVLGRSGTGLGLTVVWNTVDENEGKIFVKSNEQGTSFQLYFPTSQKQEIAQIEKESSEKLRGNGEHILVVDDEPHLRDIATLMLQTLGYQVDSVCSGELALKFVTKNPVDLIVIDMLMEPGMNGRQTYEKITTLYPNQKAIIASGFSESDDVKATLTLGAGGFIKKPYSMEELGQAVKETLENR